MNNKNQKKRGWSLRVWAALCVVIILLLFGIEYGKKTPDIITLLQNIGMSICCSIVASAIFLYVQKGIDEDHSSEMSEKLNNIDEALKIQQSLYSSGIKSIRRKEYYDAKDSFWKEIVQSTEKKLDLTGHSLSNWFADEYKEVFCDRIKQMLNGGSKVRIVLSSSDYSKYTSIDWKTVKKKNENELEKIEKTCLELREILRNVTYNERKQLKVYVTDKKNMTYMYIRTDNQCLISPYLFDSQSSGDTFLLELQSGAEYSKCFEKDFIEIMRNSKPVKLL